MMEYDEHLEDLLLDKPYEALNEAERSHADRLLGGEDEYAFERSLRLQVQAVILAESAPADEGGAARLMARVGPRGWAHWQVAAAVFLAALLAWSARGLLPEATPAGMERFAVADTVLKEVRIMDTVYLPAPDSGLSEEDEGHPLEKEKDLQKSPRNNPMQKKRTQPGKSRTKLTGKLAEAIAQLPDPGSVIDPGGVQINPRMPRMEGEAKVDKFNLQ